MKANVLSDGEDDRALPSGLKAECFDGALQDRRRGKKP